MSRKGHRARVHESCCNTPSKLIQFCPEHDGAIPLEGCPVCHHLTRLRDENERWKRAFEHIHVNAHDGTDACKQCELDLRDAIHIRAALEQHEQDTKCPHCDGKGCHACDARYVEQRDE